MIRYGECYTETYIVEEYNIETEAGLQNALPFLNPDHPGQMTVFV
jgi:hypothetical protein